MAMMVSGSIELQHDLVHVAPAPVLARLDRAHDRMLRGVKVLGGGAVLGIVTAADVAAGAAQPQVHPAVTELETFLAAAAARLVGADEVQVMAACGHGTSHKGRPPVYTLALSTTAAHSRASARGPQADCVVGGTGGAVATLVQVAAGRDNIGRLRAANERTHDHTPYQWSRAQRG